MGCQFAPAPAAGVLRVEEVAIQRIQAHHDDQRPQDTSDDPGPASKQAWQAGKPGRDHDDKRWCGGDQVSFVENGPGQRRDVDAEHGHTEIQGEVDGRRHAVTDQHDPAGDENKNDHRQEVCGNRGIDGLPQTKRAQDSAEHIEKRRGIPVAGIRHHHAPADDQPGQV